MTTSATPAPAEGSQPWWSRAVLLISGLLSAIGGLYWATHDTPKRRAANEAIWLANQGKDSDVELAKEHTKQMKISARAAGVLQPLVAPKPQAKGRGTIEAGSEGRHFLSPGINFTFDGDGGNTPSAVIAFRQPPASTTGEFKIFALGKTAWTDGWDGTPSPYPLEQLLAETISTESNVRYFPIFSKGKTTFNM